MLSNQDRAMAVTLRAAQWLLDDVASGFGGGQATPEMWQELRGALHDLIRLVDERTDIARPTNHTEPTE